jgi:HD-GYP domain-containing protein (c-di-GMP phosphodiesterase class II)
MTIDLDRKRTVGDAAAADRAGGALPGELTSKLAALQSLNAQLIFMREESQAYSEMVSAARKLIGCDSCALFIYDEARRCLVLRASHGFPEDLEEMTIPLEEGQSTQRQAFMEGYLVYVPDTRASSGRPGLLPEIRSELAMAIYSNQGPVGLFDIGRREPDGFAEHEIQFCSVLVDQIAFSLENMRLLRNLTATRNAVIRGMALLAESRDGHIGGHLDRICATARLMAGQLHHEGPYVREVDEEFVETISQAAALHDIGKVGIPDSILQKPSSLSTGEFEIMKTHTTIGGDLLLELMHDYGHILTLRMGAEVAYGHHECWDGSGYPRGMKGRDVPLAARIVSICDVYDALTSERIYKEAWDHERVCQVIRAGAGSQFDPYLVDVFVALAPQMHEISARLR